jgi:dihydroorotate dehydrogenase electron transfer subunit
MEMFLVKAKIIFNKKVKNEYFHCGFLASGIAKKALPGQFVDIRVNDSAQPLLRRPFGVHRVNGRRVEILYEVVGEATRILSGKKPGEYLDVLGPLGNGFSMLDSRCSILVAGGMGAAPLLFLGERLRKLRTQDSGLRTIALIGARTKEHIICDREFKRLGCEVKVSTDDGSRGFNGRVTELLKKILLTTHNSELITIYACGPHVMLKELASLSRDMNIPAQISLEEHMSCGIGACLGCVVNTRDGYKRVCKEGPVFNADTVVW